MRKIVKTERAPRRKEPPTPFSGEVAPFSNLCQERTELMDWEPALRYHEAMQRAGFSNLKIVASRDRFYVRFSRPPMDCQTDEGMRERRLQRGVLQYDEMAFALVNASSPRSWHYVTHFYPDGSAAPVYVTHVSLGCNCPDHTYRRNLTDGLCKHQCALAIHQGRNLMEERMEARERLRRDMGMAPLNAPAAERRAWVEKNRDLDF